MKYISILRGINVSGQKKIRMTDLKSLYELLGFRNVVTYIQSGNVIFDSVVTNQTDLKARIEGAIEKRFGFHVPAEIRTSREISDIVKHCPFGPVDLVEDGTKIFVTFLSSDPSEAKIAGVQKYVAATEKLVVRGKEVYLFCPNGYGKCRLSNTFLEHKLGIEATTRNWRSVHRSYELSVENNRT